MTSSRKGERYLGKVLYETKTLTIHDLRKADTEEYWADVRGRGPIGNLGATGAVGPTGVAGPLGSSWQSKAVQSIQAQEDEPVWPLVGRPCGHVLCRQIPGQSQLAHARQQHAGELRMA